MCLIYLYLYYRRKDRDPGKNSGVCSCHFRDEKKENGPEIFKRNVNKLFPSPSDGKPPKKRRREEKSAEPTVREIVEAHKAKQQKSAEIKIPTSQIILQAELDCVRNDLKQQEQTAQYNRSRYTASSLSSEALRKETGLPTKEVFQIVVQYAARFKDSMVYYAGWRVESISFEDQVFITLMKLRQNYTNLHLGQLFLCSVRTISNIVTTFIHVLHSLLFNYLMTSMAKWQLET